jgi:adhesin transport system membrane fusion protein
MRQSDFAFVNDIRAASELATPVTSRILLAAIIALVITGVVWAHFAVLDEVKSRRARSRSYKVWKAVSSWKS